MKKKSPEFGSRLADYRKKAGLTQSELAGKLNISVAMMKYYETRAKNPNLAILQQISRVLKISTDELLTGKKNTRTGPKSSLEKCFERVSRLSPKRQKQIISVIEALIKEK